MRSRQTWSRFWFDGWWHLMIDGLIMSSCHHVIISSARSVFVLRCSMRLCRCWCLTVASVCVNSSLDEWVKVHGGLCHTGPQLCARLIWLICRLIMSYCCCCYRCSLRHRWIQPEVRRPPSSAAAAFSSSSSSSLAEPSWLFLFSLLSLVVFPLTLWWLLCFAPYFLCESTWPFGSLVSHCFVFCNPLVPSLSGSFTV